jgi:hypothetical protein
MANRRSILWIGSANDLNNQIANICTDYAEQTLNNTIYDERADWHLHTYAFWKKHFAVSYFSLVSQGFLKNSSR